MAHILVIRFAALGDVAMTIPVVSSLATRYPQYQITMLSNRAFAPLFEGLPANIHFWGADLKSEHKGFKGIFRLYSQVRGMGFDVVVDLNSVFRSFVLDACLFLSGGKVHCVRKEKAAQRRLTRLKRKQLVPVKSTFRRYHDTFSRAGFDFALNFSRIGILPEERKAVIDIFGKKDRQWVGVAPFAKEKGKIYPLHLQEQVLQKLVADTRIRVFLFGGGKQELAVFEEWKQKYPQLTIVWGKVNMHQEVVLMSCLDVMLSMDSANMHMASLAGTPVVSVWGATHPYNGFMGWRQSEQYAVQADMPCRPCSAHGTKACYKQNWECMSSIQPETIIHRIAMVLEQIKAKDETIQT